MINVLNIYKPVFETDATVVDLLGGRGRGASHFMAQHALIMLCTADYYNAFFMRAVHKDVRTSLWEGFRLRFKEAVENEDIDGSTFVISDREMTIINKLNGNKIRAKGFRTGSGGQTANLKSLEGSTNVYIEECEEITLEQSMTLSDSLRTTKAKLLTLRAWNVPTKEHHLVKSNYDIESVTLTDSNNKEQEGYFKLISKGNPGHLMIFGTYHDNIKHIPKEKIQAWENYYYTNIDHYITDICGFASGGVKGVIFKYQKHWLKYTELPDFDFFKIYALDFGGGGGATTDEPDGRTKTVLIELNINKATMSCYLKLLVYKGYISSDDLCLELDKLDRECPILADNARADKIMELQNKGYFVFGAKTKEGKSSGVVSGYDFMFLYMLYVLETDTQIHVELNNHRWAINNITKEPTGQPEDKWKDVPDAIRYGVVYYHLNYNY